MDQAKIFVGGNRRTSLSIYKNKLVAIVLDDSTRKLLTFARSKFQVFNTVLVRDAVNFAIKANEGEKRLYGTQVIDYLLCTAILLASTSDSKAVVASGLLLHNCPCDTMPQYEFLKNEFGSEVATLVRDVSKLRKLSKISREEELVNSKLMPELILTVVKDVRSVMIQIADHTIQMIALDKSNPEEKQSFVKETLDVYIRLSERLRFDLWKNQLQILCSNVSDDLKNSYESVSEDDDDGIAFEVKLEEALEEERLPYIRVESRKKSLHSIQNKMSLKEIDFSNIRDIIGLRIIVENEEECYKAKEVVEKLWKANPEFEKDYIKSPKQEGYRSLHVSVKNAKDQYMEVQIRTNQMHMASNEAHELYKAKARQLPEHVKSWVEFSSLVNKQARRQASRLGNSSVPRAHRRACPFAEIDKPPCLDAKGNCQFHKKTHMYVIVKDKNEVTIKQHPIGTLSRNLCLQMRWAGQVLVNDVPEGLNYILRAGDIIEFVFADSVRGLGVVTRDSQWLEILSAHKSLQGTFGVATGDALATANGIRLAHDVSLQRIMLASDSLPSGADCPLPLKNAN